MQNSLEVELQVDRVVKKVLDTLAFIGQSIECRSWDIRLRLYRTLGEGVQNKVRGERFKKDLRSNIFMQRVVYVWNEVPEEVEEAGTIVAFKRHLD
eukprot:g29722.t1